ncbi:MAG TPA: glycosyltransferase family 4 protein [Stellaceae bacterium]|nr:glycosyltransferase family 4 protein [Stellaceae bacterium]
MTALLALVTEAFGGRGGIAQYNRDLLRALASAGTAVTTLPRMAPDAAPAPAGVRQRRPRGGRIAFSLTALLTAALRRFDIVFCGHLFMAPLALLAARIARARLVVQLHGIEAWPRPSRLRRLAVERADLVLCVSRYTRRRVLNWATVAPERVLVLPNTCGAAFAPGDRAEVRGRLGLAGRRVLLTVGRLDRRERYKGHDRVIRALPDLVAQGHDIVYLVVGDGDDADRLAEVANACGVADRVRFLGRLRPEALRDVYRAADLFVMPSTGEGFGIAFLEAAASGTAAVGLDAGGAADALAEGELGVLASEKEFPDAVARCLAAPPPDRAALAGRVRRRFGEDAFQARARLAFEQLRRGE